MHTGLPGRKQIYSYVQDNDGTWWKTVDYDVVEARFFLSIHILQI